MSSVTRVIHINAEPPTSPIWSATRTVFSFVVLIGAEGASHWLFGGSWVIDLIILVAIGTYIADRVTKANGWSADMAPEEIRDWVADGMPAKVNLIPFNPWPGSKYEPSGKVALEKFAGIVNAAGFASPVRTPRGQDILAACGQLRTESRRRRAGA